MAEQLLIGVPKGSLQESTLNLFQQAGIRFSGSERTLWLSSNDPEIKPVLLRPQEIPRYVADGSLDCGLAGYDWMVETNCLDRVHELADLCYSKRSFRPVRWVLAVAEDAPYQTIDDLRRFKGRKLRISTELVNTTSNWLAERGIIADVNFSWGATEAKVPVFADAIVDVTETGSSLRANRLRIVDELLPSTTRFFVNKKVYRDHEWKRQKAEGLGLLLSSCLAADTKVRVNVTVPDGNVDSLKAAIGANGNVAVWAGVEGDSLFEIVTDKDDLRTLVPTLVRNGATGYSVTSLTMLYE